MFCISKWYLEVKTLQSALAQGDLNPDVLNAVKTFCILLFFSVFWFSVMCIHLDGV